MAKGRWTYWGGFAALAAGSLALLFLFVFGFLPQRFLLELDFAESGYSYPVVRPQSPLAATPEAVPAPTQPVPRAPAERFWAEYLNFTRSGESEAALRLLAGYLEEYPVDVGARLEYARALWRQGDLEAAAAEYRQALANSASLATKRELARLLVTARDWDAALELYEELAGARPDDAELLREYAEAATWAERYDRALPLYARLVELAPEDAGLRLKWGQILYWSDHPERAAEVLAGLPAGYASASVDSLRALVAIALPPPPDTTTPVLSLLEQARALAMAGDADSALALYQLYRADHPAADSLLLEMADVLEYRASAPERAMDYLRAYLVRHPDAQDVRLRLARLLAWSGQLSEAEATALAIVGAQPENAQAWALLGDLYRWRGERVAASRAYRRALELDPEEPTAVEGLAALRSQVDAELATKGRIGPAGGFDYFADSEEFSHARWSGAWSAGTPRNRAGVEVAVEHLNGYDLTGERGAVTGAAAKLTGERWWLAGGLHASAAVGAWIPESGASVEPTVSLELTAPNMGGASYRLEYQHGPAFPETATLEAAVADLRVDLARLELYRPLSGRWDLSARAGLARFSGVGDANLRANAALGVFFRPSDHWIFGYEMRGLSFSNPAPNPGRRLYWDPNWSWEHSALLAWRGESSNGWGIEARATPGVAWLDERDADRTLAVLLGGQVEANRRFGAWTLAGRTGYSQSRAGRYRSFGFELELSRGFGR